MKTEELFELINEIDDDYIVDAHSDHQVKRWGGIWIASALTAALVILAIGMAIFNSSDDKKLNNNESDVAMATTGESQAQQRPTAYAQNGFVDTDTEDVIHYAEDSTFTKAVKAHKTLFDHFYSASEGYAYPASFAGDYILDGILHICVTDESDAEAICLMAGGSEGIAIEYRDITLEAFERFQDDLWEHFKENDLLPNIAYVDQVNGVMVIGFDENELEAARGLLNAYIKENDLEILEKNILLKCEGEVKKTIMASDGSQMANNSTFAPCSPAIGSSVYRYSATYGVAYATILATNVTISTSDGITIKGLTMAYFENVSACGNNGGLYRQGVLSCGVHYGNSTTEENVVFFLP